MFTLTLNCLSLTLVRPAMDEDKLRNASTLTESELRPEFVGQMQVIRDRILNMASPKKVLGQVFDGQKLCHLIRCYVETMNNGSVPDIKAAWGYVSEASCQAAMYHAFEQYKEVMQMSVVSQNVPTSQHDFERVYKEAQDAALVIFKNESVEGEARRTCFQKLKSMIQQDRLVEINSLQQKSTTFCENIIARLSDEYFRQPILSGSWDTKDKPSNESLAPFFAAYDSQGEGPSKNKVLLNFLKGDMLSCFDSFHKRISDIHADVLQKERMKSRAVIEVS